MQGNLNALQNLLFLPVRHHFFGSLGIVIFVAVVISGQVTDRRRFANGELYRDVMDRWGAPIVQPAPSLRFVESGTVFNQLGAMPLERQEIAVDARMNYRKRGLVYFSGFEFDFRADYRVTNAEGHDVDAVFVFPIDLEKNKVMLSDLEFAVGGQPASIDLGPEKDKLVWTGQIRSGAAVDFHIAYRGRGLDSFTYRLDPAAPVRGFRLALNVAGGRNHDYAEGVIPAGELKQTDDGIALLWSFAALESGVPVGVIVPSEKSFDQVIATMLRRSWVPFIGFFAGVVALSVWCARRPAIYETYLVAAGYAFFYVLLAYLSAYMHFYLAYAVTLLIIATLLRRYLGRILSPAAGRVGLLLLTAFLFVPTLAVILEGHTGLIYALEILAGIAVLMALTTRPVFRTVAAELVAGAAVLVLVVAWPLPAAAADAVAASPAATPEKAPAAPAPAAASATLPLREILRLYRETEAAKGTEVAAPPFAATVGRLELEARLLDDGLDLQVHVEVTVLASGQWTTVPFLELGAATSVADLPPVEGAVIVRERGTLALATERAGTYAFDLALVERARARDRVREVRLHLPAATFAVLHVRHDESLFRIVRPGGRPSAEGLLVYPEGDVIDLAWERLAAEPEGRREVAAARAIEPAAPRAFASVVSTLEGRRIWRLRYELRFGGNRPITLELPSSLKVSTVYCNGVSVPFAVDDAGRLTVEVAPVRAGDESGTLELVAIEEAGGYLLSGTLRFGLPRLSWPVSELYLEVNLPPVFNYEWKGGSLSPAEAFASPGFSHELPLPGKRLTFHQYLISASAPALEMRYAIDLKGSYFR